ncbi:MAG TPA: hypothetical protein VK480_05220, partial [Solirubrobacterales bacterium]|nr:hypothetical protein [Solirubrobacterales bacterium]
PEGDLGVPPTGEAGEASAVQYGEQASESTGDSSSTAGAVLLGLLAGCVLFLAGLGGRKAWMRWRYGL